MYSRTLDVRLQCNGVSVHSVSCFEDDDSFEAFGAAFSGFDGKRGRSKGCDRSRAHVAIDGQVSALAPNFLQTAGRGGIKRVALGVRHASALYDRGTDRNQHVEFSPGLCSCHLHPGVFGVEFLRACPATSEQGPCSRYASLRYAPFR